MLRVLTTRSQLLSSLVRREVRGRYRGSVLGLFWTAINPLLLLATYTIVFSVVFKARWGHGVESQGDFAAMLFVGMVVHGLFAETLLRAPTLIRSNVNYVKKTVFPIEILPVVTVGAAVVHAAVSLSVLTLAVLVRRHGLPLTACWLPLVIAPLLPLTLGIAWLLASLGVYLRDIGQPIGLVMTLLMFGSPVFYPVDALPAAVRPWLNLNPLTLIIVQARTVLLEGQAPDATALAAYLVVALMVAWGGYAWFQKTRKGFANVL
jgi:lipopolysaccharide transport system permease protein